MYIPKAPTPPLNEALRILEKERDDLVAYSLHYQGDILVWSLVFRQPFLGREEHITQHWSFIWELDRWVQVSWPWLPSMRRQLTSMERFQLGVQWALDKEASRAVE